MTRARDLADSADKDISGTVVLDDITLSNDISIADNGKALFGDGDDLQIYHDGSHSWIKDVGTGDLTVSGDNLYLEKGNGTKFLYGVSSTGQVRLYYGDDQKFVTTSTGVAITGTAVTDGLTVAGNVSVDGGTIKLDGNYPVGTYNVAIGNEALDSVTTGPRNTGLGNQALTSVTSAGGNTGVGAYALRDTIGAGNTAVGDQALILNTTGINNVAVGTVALDSNTTGSYNTSLGQGSLGANTTANENTAVGYQASFDNTTGTRNTSVGYHALHDTTTGSDNSAIGQAALYSNSTGSNNVALGRHALLSNTTASNNTAVGYQAGYTNQTGSYNTFVGRVAGYSANNTGNVLNAFFGEAAGYSCTTGFSNTFIGANAGDLITTGHDNTILGRYNGNQGGLDIRTSDNNIVLSDGDGNVRLHYDASLGTTYLKGDGTRSDGGNLNLRNIQPAYNLYSPSTQWIKVYDVHYLPSGFQHDIHELTILSNGSTNGAYQYGKILISHKQQGAGDLYQVHLRGPTQNMLSGGGMVAYKFTAGAGNYSAGFLEVWVNSYNTYMHMFMNVRTSATGNTDVGGYPQMTATGSNTQPSGSTLIASVTADS